MHCQSIQDAVNNTKSVDAGRVFIHPGSINFDVGKFESGWVVYTDMVATSKLYVRESSAVPIYALLLFGGETAHAYHTQACTATQACFMPSISPVTNCMTTAGYRH